MVDTRMPQGLAQKIINIICARENFELVVVSKGGAFVGSEFKWNLAHPDFPDFIIGWLITQDWHLLEPGMRVETSLNGAYLREEALVAAAKGAMRFRYVRKELEPGQVVEGIIAEFDPRNDARRTFYVKNTCPGIVPSCLLPDAKRGDRVAMHILGRADVNCDYLGKIGVPENYYLVIQRLFKQISEGDNVVEIEITGGLTTRNRNHGFIAYSVVKGYWANLTLEGIKLLVFFEGNQVLERGQKVKAKIRLGSHPTRDYSLADFVGEMTGGFWMENVEFVGMKE